MAERSNLPQSVNATCDRNSNTNMTTLSKRIIVLFFVATFLAVAGMGRNTAHGFGKDVQKTGEKIQEGTK